MIWISHLLLWLWFGSVMTPARITNLRVSLKMNQTYVTIRKRDKSVSHLQKKTKYKNTKKMMKSRNYSNGQNIKKCLKKSQHTTPHKIKMEKKHQIIIIYTHNMCQYISDWNHHQIKISAPWNLLDPIILTPNIKSGHLMKNQYPSKHIDCNQHPVKIAKQCNSMDPTILTPTRTIKNRRSDQMNQSNKSEQQSNNHES
jgi:hypothetical protein